MRVVYIILACLVLFHLFILSRLDFFPYPEIFIYPYLVDKAGLVAYSQIFDQHFPGLLLTAFNFRDFGVVDPASARIFYFVVLVLVHAFLFLISRRILKSAFYALASNVIFVFLHPLFDGHIFWIDSIIPLVLLTSFYFCIKVFDRRANKALFVFASGVLAGLAILFKQTYIVLPLLVIIWMHLYSRVSKKLVMAYVAGVGVPIAALLSWVLVHGLWSEFYYWTFLFNFSIYPSMARKLPSLYEAIRVLVYFLPVIFGLIFLKEKRYYLLVLFTIVGVIGALTRFEFIHFQPSLPFVVIALVALFKERRLFEGAKIALLLFLAASTLVWSWKYYLGNWGDRTYFFGQSEKRVVNKVKDLTRSSEKIFVLGAQPTIYLLSERFPSGGLFSVNVPWNMVVVEDIILKGLKTDPPYVVVRNRSATLDGELVVDYMRDIDEFISSEYEAIDVIEGNEIMVRKI